MADGYAKIEGKPLAVMAHSTVGLQHASMAIYNAFAAQSPAFIILGNTLDATARRPGVEWLHSAQDAASMVRDYSKWDDLPISLGHFAESATRAYKIAMTPPMGPVLLVADSDLQETPMEPGTKLRIPKADAERTARRRLRRGSRDRESCWSPRKTPPSFSPIAPYARPAGMKFLVELAETISSPRGLRKIPVAPSSQSGQQPRAHRERRSHRRSRSARSLGSRQLLPRPTPSHQPIPHQAERENRQHRRERSRY